jgi:hypothetical protein
LSGPFQTQRERVTALVLPSRGKPPRLENTGRARHAGPELELDSAVNPCYNEDRYRWGLASRVSEFIVARVCSRAEGNQGNQGMSQHRSLCKKTRWLGRRVSRFFPPISPLVTV